MQNNRQSQVFPSIIMKENQKVQILIKPSGIKYNKFLIAW